MFVSLLYTGKISAYCYRWINVISLVLFQSDYIKRLPL